MFKISSILMQNTPRTKKLLNILDTLVQAWFTGHQVNIHYRLPGDTKIHESVVETLFYRAPSATTTEILLVNRILSFKTRSLRSFKLARIQSAEINTNTYNVYLNITDLNIYTVLGIAATFSDNRKLTTVGFAI